MLSCVVGQMVPMFQTTVVPVWDLLTLQDKSTA